MRLRLLGISIKYATLEANGQLGYELKDDCKPLTIKDFKNVIDPKCLNKEPQPQKDDQANLFEEIKRHRLSTSQKILNNSLISKTFCYSKPKPNQTVNRADHFLPARFSRNKKTSEADAFFQTRSLYAPEYAFQPLYPPPALAIMLISLFL